MSETGESGFKGLWKKLTGQAARIEVRKKAIQTINTFRPENESCPTGVGIAARGSFADHP